MDIRLKKIKEKISTIDKEKEIIKLINWVFQILNNKPLEDLSLKYKENVYSLNATERAGDNMAYEKFGDYMSGQWVIIPSHVSKLKENLPLTLFLTKELSRLGFMFHSETYNGQYLLRLNYGSKELLKVSDRNLSYCLYYSVFYIYLNWNKMKFIENLD